MACRLPASSGNLGIRRKNEVYYGVSIPKGQAICFAAWLVKKLYNRVKTWD